MNGLVHPFKEKCQSLNWSWVRGLQLAPHGLDPNLDTRMKCDYGEYAPYNHDEIRKLERVQPFRAWNYPEVTMCGKLGPLLYSNCNCLPKGRPNGCGGCNY